MTFPGRVTSTAGAQPAWEQGQRPTCEYQLFFLTYFETIYNRLNIHTVDEKISEFGYQAFRDSLKLMTSEIDTHVGSIRFYTGKYRL